MALLLAVVLFFLLELLKNTLMVKCKTLQNTMDWLQVIRIAEIFAALDISFSLYYLRITMMTSLSRYYIDYSSFFLDSEFRTEVSVFLTELVGIIICLFLAAVSTSIHLHRLRMQRQEELEEQLREQYQKKQELRMQQQPSAAAPNPDPAAPDHATQAEQPPQAPDSAPQADLAGDAPNSDAQP